MEGPPWALARTRPKVCRMTRVGLVSISSRKRARVKGRTCEGLALPAAPDPPSAAPAAGWNPAFCCPPGMSSPEGPPPCCGGAPPGAPPRYAEIGAELPGENELWGALEGTLGGWFRIDLHQGRAQKVV